ncbi:MAG: fumarylacetoacetate hydrolase family protein [Bacteroidetes bacterium]|nr:fumarylacetoacetate hydrolase family protein [Bacteroidota bacterium]
MKIICVGRNYAQHAREMNAPLPQEPVLFIKPDNALLRENTDFYIPDWTQEVHYECEVFYRIGRKGKYIDPKYALGYVDGIGLGIDFTARDVQQRCKEQGLPWEIAKGFDHSAAVSTILPLSELADPFKVQFELYLNGELRQRAHTQEMIFPLESVMAYSSRYFSFKAGDYLFTGTPAGVGPVKAGDHLQGYLEGRLMLDFHIR